MSAQTPQHSIKALSSVQSIHNNLQASNHNYCNSTIYDTMRANELEKSRHPGIYESMSPADMSSHKYLYSSDKLESYDFGLPTPTYSYTNKISPVHDINPTLVDPFLTSAGTSNSGSLTGGLVHNFVLDGDNTSLRETNVYLDDMDDEDLSLISSQWGISTCGSFSESGTRRGTVIGRSDSEVWLDPLLTPLEPPSYIQEEIYNSSLSQLSPDGQWADSTGDYFGAGAITDALELDEQLTAEILLQSLEESESVVESPLASERRLSEDERKQLQLGPRRKSNFRIQSERLKIPKSGQMKLGKARDEIEYVPVYEQILQNPAIHRKISQIKKKGIYKCAHCTEFFTDLFKLAQHLDEFRVHRAHKCPFTDCPWSILGLPRKAEVRRHCAAQHELMIDLVGEESPGNIQSFFCGIDGCKKVFKRKDSFNRHQRLVHLTSTSRFNKRIEKQRRKDEILMEKYTAFQNFGKKKVATNKDHQEGKEEDNINWKEALTKTE